MKTTAPSQYDEQASAFLAACNVSLTIRRADPYGPGKAPKWLETPDQEHGNQYRVTLRGKDRASVSFDFWGSINDRRALNDPSAYDVLACLSGDINCRDTFEEFCGDYGYDPDSRK